MTFHNADNGFCVLRVKARGQRDSITVVGHAAMISAGEFAQVPMVVTSISATLPMRKKVVRKLLAIVQDRIPKRFGLDPIREIQVLCPMSRGGLGARSLSIELQKQLNSPAEINAACPMTVIGSRWPRALTRSTQKPLSELWKVTRSTRPARTSVELTVDVCAIL